MGLFSDSNSSKPGGIASGFDKYKSIGRKEADKFLVKLTSNDRGKIKNYLKPLGSVHKSLSSISSSLGKDLGVGMKRKFESAAKKFYAGTSSGKPMRIQKALDFSALEENQTRTERSILGNVGGGVKGDASRLGLKQATTGFAGQSKTNTGIGNLNK